MVAPDVAKGGSHIGDKGNHCEHENHGHNCYYVTVFLFHNGVEMCVSLN
jgi:hypothetical protein